MKLTVDVVERKQVEIDVVFPIYRKHDITGSGAYRMLYVKTDQLSGGSLVEHSVIDRDDSVEIQARSIRKLDKSDLEYTLGKGEYHCTEAEFIDVLAKAKTIFDQLTAKP